MRFSIGIPIVDWVYGKQTDGKLKWLPDVGEISGFVWIAAIDLTIIVSLITLAIWLIL